MPAVPMTRVQIENVSVELLGGVDNPRGTPVQHDNRIDDLVIRRVLFQRATSGFATGAYSYVQYPWSGTPDNPDINGSADVTAKSARFRFLDNIVDTVDSIFRTSASNSSIPNLNAMNDSAPNGYRVEGNVWPKTGGAATLPGSNYQPPDVASIGFVDYAGGNYALASGSAAKGTATDGGDPGPDQGLLASRLTGVV